MARRCTLVTMVLISIMIVISSSYYVGKAATLAALYIDPPETEGLNIGDFFTVNIKIANITNLAGWQVELFYSTQVIAATDVKEGPFLKSAANTIFVSGPQGPFDNDYNTTHGRIYVACATLPSTGVSGSGTLFNVTFQAVGAGSTMITITRDPEITKLLDNTFGAPQPIPHSTADGLVSLIANDIGVTAITVSKTIVNDTQITINVTVANLGNYTATFDTFLYYDSTEIGNQTVTDLPASTSLILTFIWDTSTVPKGNYTIRAYAPPIIGEDITANNELIDGWIVETMLGDVNGDGRVNILDISIVAKAFQSTPSDPRWEPNADLDNNGVINIIDITKVAKEFGKVDP